MASSDAAASRDAAKDLRDEVAAYRANGTIITEETLRGWERRLTSMAFPAPSEEQVGISDMPWDDEEGDYDHA